MIIKKLLKELIPPIFFRMSNRSTQKKLQPTFKSYSDALAAAESMKNKILLK